MDLKNKVAVITGAGSGIGQACAGRLAKEGMKVILLGGRNAEKLNETRTIVEAYSECTVIPGDLTELSIMEQAVCQAADAWNGIDVLINNAGMALNSSFEEVTVEEYDKIMNINVRVPFFLTQKMLPYLKKSDAATVINISSVTGHLGYPYQSAYAASKHAVLGFTKSLANEYYQDNIRVHAICPGGVYTDMVKVARPDLAGEGLIQPEEIAEIVHFFLANRGNAVIDEINVHRVNKAPFAV